MSRRLPFDRQDPPDPMDPDVSTSRDVDDVDDVEQVAAWVEAASGADAAAIAAPQPKVSSSGCGLSTRTAPGPVKSVRAAEGASWARRNTCPSASGVTMPGPNAGP